MTQLTLPAGLSFPQTALEVSIEFDEHLRTGQHALYQPISTGFEALDVLLGGGLHSESLLLVGGPPGVGKTVFALQVARNIAVSGQAVSCVVCFEHSPVYLFHRLLCMESFLGAGQQTSGVTLEDIRQLVSHDSPAGLQTVLDAFLPAREAWERIVRYWEQLFLVKGHPVKTTLQVLDAFLTWLRARNRRVVLFVDYLQKVPVFTPGLKMTPERQIRLVTEGLKNLALAHHVPIVAVAASDSEGLKNERVRFEDLWGGTSIQYEPDVALMLNRGSDADVDFSIEKNRMGPTNQTVQQHLWGELFAFSNRASDQGSSEPNAKT